MNEEKTVNQVEIVPKRGYLSPTELITLRHVEIEPPRVGLKRTQNENSPEELAELEIAYANLRTQLSVPRIERLAGRSLAIYHKDQQVVEVLRKDGKFEHFGYSHKGKFYLEYYEALFLVELNRLQLEHEGIILSMEQNYNFLLGPAACDRYNHYLVYSCLSRLGYIVVRHRKPEVSRDDCIWALLEEKICHKPIVDDIRTTSFFHELQSRMEASTQRIISQEFQPQHDATEFIYNFGKRKACEEDLPAPSAVRKRVCLPTNQSLVDVLKADSSYLRFKRIFQKFDIVKLAKTTAISCNDSIKLNITFDLYLPNEGFRKSLCQTPSFNVVILPMGASFPTHNDVARLQSSVPLLIISVSESKQIQAFLYYIS
ncbi:uncharacterized protein Tsen54 [Drosophila tropicalis]|uniref:uncharacterized protein Tsen54 n=1 Tax=Drosophila tropicalis TaxID=46794 RepID=UPI0035ABD01C